MRIQTTIAILTTTLFALAGCGGGDSGISKKGQPTTSEETTPPSGKDDTPDDSIDGDESVCGDDRIEGDEECEVGQTPSCEALGFDRGESTCVACEIDTTGCERDSCGDGVIDPEEACDDGPMNGRYGHCNDNCTGPASFCGDGVLDFEEACDSDVFRDETCETLGFEEGTLGCTTECTIDRSGCSTCGNGVVEGDEECDEGDSNGEGDCALDCTIHVPSCGDGNLDDGEECEAGNLQGESCESLGAGLGALACTGCTFDLSACSNAPRPGEVIFTEIMQNPKIQSDADAEWFEVKNLSNRLVDLEDCVITSDRGQSTESFTVNSTATIASQDYFVFSISSSVSFTSDYIYNGKINLANTSDSLELYCDDPISQSVQLVDRVAWDSASFPSPDGASMTLDSVYFTSTQNDAGENWCEGSTVFGVGDRGTPGSANDSCF